MFKNADRPTKVVIAVLLGMLVVQGFWPRKPVEVEAKVCTMEDVACMRSDELAELVGADRPVYMCIQGP
jgi:hypothetical protein